MWMTIGALLLLDTAQAACPADQKAMSDAVRATQQAYESGDKDSFGTLYAEVMELTGCVSELMLPQNVAWLHQLRAIAAWEEGNTNGVVMAFRGALSARPDYDPGFVLAPQGGGLRHQLERAQLRQAQLGGGGSVDLGRGPVYVDGIPSSGPVPTERAALVQWRTSSGEMESCYLFGGGDWQAFALGTPTVVVAPKALASAPLAESTAEVESAIKSALAELEAQVPAEEVQPAETAVPPPEPVASSEAQAAAALPEAPRERIPKLGLLIAGGTSGVLGITGLIVAAKQKSKWEEMEDRGFFLVEDEEAAHKAFRINQVTGYGGYVLSAASVGLFLGVRAGGKF